VGVEFGGSFRVLDWQVAEQEDRETSQSQPKTLCDYHPKNVPLFRAQRHANPNLVHPLGHRIGNHLSLLKTPFAFNSGRLLAILIRPAHNRYGPQRLRTGREVTVTPARIERIQDSSVALTTSLDSMQMRFLVWTAIEQYSSVRCYDAVSEARAVEVGDLKICSSGRWHVSRRVYSRTRKLDELKKCGPIIGSSFAAAKLCPYFTQGREIGFELLGETVAAHLEQLFFRHGPPLVLKRDNGPNLNQQAVDEVLTRYLDMPLNSPPHYPPYNGGMECAVRELKTPLVEKILAVRSTTGSQVQAWAEVLAHELNHRSRACLDGHIAWRVFQDAKPALKAYTLRRRREIFDWINELTAALIQVSAVHTQHQVETARRLAVETWLQRNGVITITQNKKVLPIFSEKTAHNQVAPRQPYVTRKHRSLIS
jgi:hypothetical protein